MPSEPGPRILLVEDDPSLALGLCDTLEFEGFEVRHARTGQEGIGVARAEHPDCIILDLMLPDTNGYKVCEQIRASDSVVPIIMLTARSQEADKIRGLESGADDYVTKPFSVGELVARIRAIFRRTHRGAMPDSPLTIGDATVHPASQVLERGRTQVKLSFYEVELLKFLHERAGQAVGRDEILDKVWGIEASSNNRTVDNFVVKLRKKLEPRPDDPTHILTVYGVGYKLVV
ncbi:MAG: response regulator transcription factor [Sandaracinaceae bacterium]